MDTEYFKKYHPEFIHRLVVPKEPRTVGNVPKAVEITLWLKDTFGVKGSRWINQPAASPEHLVYWFREERDFAFALLRWS